MKRPHDASITTRRAMSAVLCAAFAFGAANVQAQGYPKGPVRMIVPYPPGGGADTLARLVAAKMRDKLGQQVMIDNRPGGNTIIGTEYAVKQPADGQTLLYIPSSFSINPSLYKVPYSTENDFAPIALVAQVPFMLVSNLRFPIRTVQDLIKLAKQKPGVITFATYGPGSPAHLAGELFKFMTNTEMLHIPYKGSAPALTDVVGGQVFLSFSSIEPAIVLVKANKLRPIAVTTAQRIGGVPDVPTIAESGVPGFEAVGWNGIVAPAGTPPDIVQRLNNIINDSIALPDMRERFHALGVQIDLKTPATFAAMIRAEITKWAQVIKRANIKSPD
jgi:tripartite-type tricarboxylate transporter receptor subunit TctC